MKWKLNWKISLAALMVWACMTVTPATAQRYRKSSFQIREWGIGPELIFNFTGRELGFGGRAHLYVGRYLFFSPEVTFFPGFRYYKELYVGAGAHYNTTPDSKWGLYGMVNLSWNRWFNYDEFVTPKAKPHNLAVEPGIGIVKNRGCLRPFGELRYNWKWHEGSIRAGLLFFFGNCQTKEFCPPAKL
ncbi:MAG: hypothetical protein KDD36_07080 [Flavobacteriales bacterium]|nr:hypothetical protein [Flavobacteriales bacterium]